MIGADHRVRAGVARRLLGLGVAVTIAVLGVSPQAFAARQPRRPRSLGSRVTVTLTSANLHDALSPEPALQFSSAGVGRVPTLHVSDAVRYQTITGFGAAMTDSSAWLIYDELPPPTRDWLLRAFFGPEGIGLNVIRVPMGASDFSATGVPYTYDDLPPGQTDPQLSQFSVAHDLPYVIPALREALAVSPAIQLLASPWTAPAWMKANDSLDDKGGQGTLLPDDYGAFAQYFVRFIQAYAAQGVPIAALTPANEPGAQSPYPGMNVTAPEEAQFVAQNLVPALAGAGLHPQLWGLDRGMMLNDATTLLQSPAAPDLAGIAWHCYGGYSAMPVLHESFPASAQIVSECSPGIIPFGAAEVAIAAARNWASAVLLWNLALDPAGGPVQPKNWACTGCTGLATVSEQTGTVSLSRNYYELGQLSRFVRPGAVRIASERWAADYRMPTGVYGVTPGLDDVAFENPDASKALVAHNTSHATLRFAVAWKGRFITYSLAPGATVTFTWR